jgi:hypothetical protein
MPNQSIRKSRLVITASNVWKNERPTTPNLGGRAGGGALPDAFGVCSVESWTANLFPNERNALTLGALCDEGYS